MFSEYIDYNYIIEAVFKGGIYRMEFHATTSKCYFELLAYKLLLTVIGTRTICCAKHWQLKTNTSKLGFSPAVLF